RNVLIYFDQPTKIDVLERLARITEQDGYLVLGAAETVVGLTECFRPLTDRRGLYVPNAAAARAAHPPLSALKAAPVAAMPGAAARQPSLALDPGRLDDRPPFGVIAADQVVERLRGAADRRRAEGEQALAHRRRLHGLGAVLGELLLDRGRQAGGGQESPPHA